MSFSRIRSVDWETTGFVEEDGRICEIGYHDIIIDNGVAKPFPEQHSILINPGVKMPPSAQAVHHISGDMLYGASKNVREEMIAVLDKADVLVAHNAAFEQSFVTTEKPWICTYKVARKLFPHLDSFSLQYLRYYFDLIIDYSQASPVHRAGPDAFVCGHLFAHLYKRMTIAEMIECSKQPVLLYRCNLPKHKDKVWEDIASESPDYLQWILQSDFDEDTTHTAAYWLKGGPKQQSNY